MNKKVNYHLKPKGFLWKLIPGSSFTAQSIYPNIYFPKYWYDNLTSKNPKPEYLALLEHEKYHFKRQERIGLLKFGFKYLFSSKFRFDEEVAAYKIQIKFLKKYNLKFPTKKIAKHLSGPLYLWSTSYKQALEGLSDVNGI